MFGLSYWFIPLFAGWVWLGTLVAMLAVWTAQGYRGYPWDNPGQHIMYISTLGATGWGKPLFITGSAVMVVCFNTTFVAERWLRHKGRLTMNYSNWEKFLSVMATLFAMAGGVGLILLTIFDTRRFPRTHQAMLALFIAGYVISAFFICAEYQRLGIHFREHRILRISFWVKLAFIIVEVALAIAFGVLEQSSDNRVNTAAVLEWIISLIYIFYVWSFIIDFLPATRTRNKQDRFGPPIRATDDEMAMNTQAHGNNLGGPVYTAGGQYNDAASYGSGVPMTEPPRNVPASRNF